MGLLTDCGHPAPEVIAAFAGVQLLVLETNYDPELLDRGPYPGWLKRRIASDVGHLSNTQSATLLTGLLDAGPPPEVVIAAHLSRTNNTPALARAALAPLLAARAQATTLLIADQDLGAPALERRQGRLLLHETDRGQLTFPTCLATGGAS
jgi:hypothetical protein